jgi:hypothetical protein
MIRIILIKTKFVNLNHFLRFLRWIETNYVNFPHFLRIFYQFNLIMWIITIF